MPHKDSDRRREYDRERHRRRAAARLARGACAKCGKHPPAPERSLCASCLERGSAAERARYARGKAAGGPLRREKPREPPAHGAGEDEETQARAGGSRVMPALRRTKTRGGRRRMRNMPRCAPVSGAEALRRQEILRALWKMRGACSRQLFQMRLVRRKRRKTPSAKERREPGALPPQARPVSLRRLRRPCGRGSEMRELRAPIVSHLGRAQGNARPSAALHRDRARHGRGARPPRLLGRGRHVPRLRSALPGGGRGRRRYLRDGETHSGPVVSATARTAVLPAAGAGPGRV